ncbi:glycosyltransferase-like protein [Scytonema sp. HK-05]|uniref:glycosyltransferase n=1 Tax=Scytonema sp. HK-05 TaxID=1137095 RepID=UPI000935C4D0|nr:glycosyltransferase [Scytonema sp. HK-05]OKH53457.1 glycosyltransferase [Scytonema sp. HK-05]BAY48236.1 glycosyltransferase-like protein [Scytonema sp. HK-05]
MITGIKSKLKNLRNQVKRILARPAYTIPYARSYIKYLMSKSQPKPSPTEGLEQYDLVFVVLDLAKGWILEAICREIATYFPGKYCFHYSESSLPPSKAYFFAHYSFVPVCLKQNPSIWGSKIFVWHTHPRSDLNIGNDELIYALNKASKVICMCSQFARLLISQGVNSQKVTYILGAADPEIFQPHQRHNNAIGFCTAFYYRKEPDRIFNIIKMMPHRKFILLGKGWEKYQKFPEMKALPNFSYIEAPYSDYPKYYALMDVFVSPAKLEGGPIPLVEAMMCNVVPVASKTGFSPDLIVHGENGLLFDVDSSIEKICELIDKAFEIQTDVRKTVEHLSWKNFSLEFQKLLK